MCIHDDPNSMLTQVDKYVMLKPDSVGELDAYLGAKLKLMQLENGFGCLAKLNMHRRLYLTV